MTVTTCRACPAAVLFVRTAAGKAMPCDAQPNAEGNVAVRRDVQGHYVGRVLRKDEKPDPHERRYMPHFATCPAKGKNVPKPVERPPVQPLPDVLPANVLLFDPTRRRRA